MYDFREILNKGLDCIYFGRGRMVDTILDDVKLLLDKGIGEKQVLEQILRASLNGEIISIHERDYVMKLKKLYDEQKDGGGASDNSSLSLLKPSDGVGHHNNNNNTLHSSFTNPSLGRGAVLPSQQLQQQQRRRQTKRSIFKRIRKRLSKKVMIGIILLLVAGAIAASIASNIDPNPPVGPSGLGVYTDAKLYYSSDIIAISGSADASLGNEVRLLIEDTDNEGDVIWSEAVRVSDDNSFSTLLIAGGPDWENTGTFTLYVQHAGSTHSTTFRFGV